MQGAYQGFLKGGSMKTSSTPFGRYLRKHRLDAGLSLRDVSTALGVSHVYVGEVERGVRALVSKERWPALVAATRGVTEKGLEEAAATTRPMQIRLEDAPPQYRDLAMSLARRIQAKDLDPNQLDQLLTL